MLWFNGITSLKEFYKTTFTTADSLAQAKKILGFGPTYDEVARALHSAGATINPTGWWAERLKTARVSGYGCNKIFDKADPKTGKFDAFSDVCPFSFQDYYGHYLELATRAGSLTRDQRNEFEQRMLVNMQALASQLYPTTSHAISVVLGKIAAAAIAIKQKQLLDEAKSRAGLATKAAKAATQAEAAADAARKGSAAEGKRAVRRAKESLDIASAAYGVLLDTFGARTSSGAAAAVASACALDKDCKKASAAVARAKQAHSAAVANAAAAARNRVLLGAAAMAGVAGVAYFILSK